MSSSPRRCERNIVEWRRCIQWAHPTKQTKSDLDDRVFQNQSKALVVKYPNRATARAKNVLVDSLQFPFVDALPTGTSLTETHATVRS